MSDVESVREALMVLHSRLQDEGYAPQSGQPDPEALFNAALAALDRMEAEEKALRERLFGWQAVYAESGRLREALKQIADDSYVPLLDDAQAIARAALEEQA